jgi:hypothetical protein
MCIPASGRHGSLPTGEPMDSTRPRSQHPSPGRYTTPTYVLSAGGRKATVPGFQPLEADEVALHNLGPHLERQSTLDPLEYLKWRSGEPHAAVEVAAASSHAPEEAIPGLDDLARRGTLRRLDLGDEQALWGAVVNHSAGLPVRIDTCPVDAGRTCSLGYPRAIGWDARHDAPAVSGPWRWNRSRGR